MSLDDGGYALSCQLRGHEDDVRGICVCGGAGIATSSRDRTVRFWSPDPSKGRGYFLSKTLVGHSSFVGPLAWIAPNDSLPEGGIVSGGMDALILLWDLAKGEAVQTMKGHRMQITGLAIAENGDIISSSLDCSIKYWKKGQVIDVLEAHKVAIQAILSLPSGELITASSDATIKLWRGKTCLRTFSGHTDTVRDLAMISDIGILSASHDGSIRLWALTGEVLMELVGHTSLVYSVDAHRSGLIASGSEDRFLKIWRGGVCIQSVEHPGCVWDVKFMDNGDVITACSDGIARIWTSQSERYAEASERESYRSLISQYKISRKSVGGLNLMELPGLEALQIPGTNDGQTVVIREGDNGVAYSWNSKESKWDKIGEVVDGPNGNSNRPMHEGVSYDYVFDVDIGDGEPIRKLPYNRSDNPYAMADKWLLKENLPLSYRQQVVDFILQNTGQHGVSFDPSFRDPYTGANAYVPGEPSGGRSFAPAESPSKPAFKHIPKRGMLLFDVAQFEGILKKVTEFNNSLLSDPKGLSLTEAELSRLSAMVKSLKDTSRYHAITLPVVDLSLLLKILRSWPLGMLFPAIDILRLIILHLDGASFLLKCVDEGNDVLIEIFRKVTAPPVLVPNLLTITRALSNLFKHSRFQTWLHLHHSEIIDVLSSCKEHFNKNIYISYSTLLLNYSVLLIDLKDQDGQAQILSAALDVAEDANQDAVSRYRSLVAVGSLMLDGLVKSIAIGLDVKALAVAAKASTEAEIAQVGSDLELLIMSP